MSEILFRLNEIAYALLEDFEFREAALKLVVSSSRGQESEPVSRTTVTLPEHVTIARPQAALQLRCKACQHDVTRPLRTDWPGLRVEWKDISWTELTFRSQTSSCPAPSPLSTHTLNLPPVSGLFSGKSVIDLNAGVGNVRNSSVWIHDARGALGVSSA